MDSWLWKSIIEAIVQGISLALVLWGIHSVWNCHKKEKLKKHISKTISANLEEILNTKDRAYMEAAGLRTPTSGRYRRVIHDHMYKQIENLLSNKTVELGLKDEMQINKAFFYIDALLSNQDFVFIKLETYEEQFIKKLKKVKWLQLEKPEHSLPFMR